MNTVKNFPVKIKALNPNPDKPEPKGKILRRLSQSSQSTPRKAGGAFCFQIKAKALDFLCDLCALCEKYSCHFE
jgi:hypothetical protein